MMDQVAIDEQVKVLASEYAHQSLGKFFISDVGAERIARRHIEQSIPLSDAVIEQCARDIFFMTLYQLPVEPMSNERLIAELDPWLPYDWNVQIHREQLALCVPCGTGPVCPGCGQNSIQITWGHQRKTSRTAGKSCISCSSPRKSKGKPHDRH